MTTLIKTYLNENAGLELMTFLDNLRRERDVILLTTRIASEAYKVGTKKKPCWKKQSLKTIGSMFL